MNPKQYSEKITFIYDFIGPGLPIPNSINYFYSYKLFEKEFKFDHDTMYHFFNNFTQLSVCNYELNIHSFFIKRLSIYSYLQNKQKHKNKKVYYLVEPFGSFFHFLGKQFGPFSDSSFIDYISEPSLTELKNNPNFYLVINYGNEGVFISNFFIQLYDILEKNNINPNKVILISSAIDINKIHDKIRKHNPKKIKNVYFGWSLKEKSKEMYNIYNNVDYNFWRNSDSRPNTIVKDEDLDEKNTRKSKFLFFNRRLRPQRMILLSLLGTSFIKNNNVSFDIDLFERDNDYDFYQHHLEDETMAKDALESSLNIFKLKKKTLDYEDIDSVWGFNFENKEPYLDSYIHICGETNFYEEGLYFSEKTWKPIGNLQPFIQVNKSGAIKELKKLGFKTFHPFINESYDDIEDDAKRILAISEEIQRLDTLSIEEIHNWYYSIKDILIYNRNHFFSFADKSNQMEYEFLKNILDYDNNR
jgi:hypothetical protein